MRWIWTAGGLGLSPVAPGTCGTLAGVAIAALSLLLPHAAGVAFVPAAAVAFFILGVPLAGVAERRTGKTDPSSFVLDEVAGYLVATSLLPLSARPFLFLGATFLLFRILDALKPWPIHRLERLPGGWGVMTDDLVAGLVANGLVRLLALL